MPDQKLVWGWVGNDLHSSDGRFEIRERTLVNPKNLNPVVRQSAHDRGLVRAERRLFVIDHRRRETHVLLVRDDPTEYAKSILAKENG